MVVDPGHILPGFGVCPEPFVQLPDLRGGVKFRYGHVVGYGGHGAQQDVDVLRQGKFAHRLDVAEHIPLGIICHARHLLAQVVCPGHDHHGFRLEGEHVLGEPAQHLACGLPRNATADETVLLEIGGILLRPVVGYGVAHQHYPDACPDTGVGLFVTAEIRPVRHRFILSLRRSAGQAQNYKKIYKPSHHQKETLSFDLECM